MGLSVNLPAKITVLIVVGLSVSCSGDSPGRTLVLKSAGAAPTSPAVRVFDFSYSNMAAEFFSKVAGSEASEDRKRLAAFYADTGYSSAAWFHSCVSDLESDSVTVICEVPRPESTIWLGKDGEPNWRSFVSFDQEMTGLHDLDQHRAILARTRPVDSSWPSHLALWWSRAMLQATMREKSRDSTWEQIELASRLAISGALDQGLVGPVGWDQSADKFHDLSGFLAVVGDEAGSFLAAALEAKEVAAGTVYGGAFTCDWLTARAGVVSVGSLQLPEGRINCLSPRSR